MDMKNAIEMQESNHKNQKYYHGKEVAYKEAIDFIDNILNYDEKKIQIGN